MSDIVPPVRRRLVRGLTVYTFHDVTDAPSEYQRPLQLATPPAVFERQIDWITQRHRVVHPDVLLDDAPSIEGGAALLTFDDGWAGIFRTAIPHLLRRGLPSLTFVNMGAVDGAPDLAAVTVRRAGGGASLPPWPTPDLVDAREVAVDADHLAFQGAYATREDLEAVSGSPLVRLGNHLHHHWLAAGLDDEQFRVAFEANERALATHPGRVPLFAFPFGRPGTHFLPHQVDLALSLGARRVFTSLPEPNPLPIGRLLHRVSLTAADRDASACWYAVHHRGVRSRLGVDR